MDQEMQPPLYNPLYEYFGYDPRCSPYRLYRPCPENASGELAGSPSGDHDNSSTRDTTISPCSAGKTDPSSEDQTGSSPQEKHAPTPEEQAILSPEDQAATRSTDQTNAATGNITSPSAEVQANTSVEAAATSSPGEIPPDLSILNNDEWLVVDPRCANPPAVAGPSNDRCHDSHHNGRYHGLRGGNRHTDWCNTTLFVGGLDANMTGEKLHYWFEGFGELMHVRKKVGQTCGFVQYGGRKEAEMAMLQMQGFPVFGARLRLSWGKPERHLDEWCWGVHRQSALRAFEGYQEFRARMGRGEPRRGSDPDFWTN
ncbi:putative mrna binding post-transcriptional regulator [Diaporthe ampelina]|uniref:Putative mrna binding post-transcriptional regulator n=1 Tax=Diaporthe ampelina TaxID=1214573 RepID=A0A0G2FG14_9PEZI|nr:putative mrna binding post-transcriptional regulator [Diaporthe ampelina]